MLMPPGMYLIIGSVRLIERLRGSKTNFASWLTSRLFGIVLPLLCLFRMWTILGLILHIHGVLSKALRDDMSKINLDKREVGQILATLTCVSVVVEMGRIATGKCFTQIDSLIPLRP